MGAILALDLGTKTGWAVHSNGAIASGTMNFAPSRYESSGMRFVRFRKFLTDLHASDPLVQIVYEEVRRHEGVGAAHVYGGFMSHLLSFAEDNGGIPTEAYPVGPIKKYWTGSGNASKEMMVARARDCGFPVRDGCHDEADALAMLHMALGGSVL